MWVRRSIEPSATMTARYTGDIPLDRIKAEFSSKFGNKIDFGKYWKTEIGFDCSLNVVESISSGRRTMAV
jgi:hypothetical protein